MSTTREVTSVKISSDDLLTVPEAARRLGKRKMTVYRWIKSGKIAVIYFSGVAFIPKSEIERLNAPKD